MVFHSIIVSNDLRLCQFCYLSWWFLTKFTQSNIWTSPIYNVSKIYYIFNYNLNALDDTAQLFFITMEHVFRGLNKSQLLAVYCSLSDMLCCLFCLQMDSLVCLSPYSPFFGHNYQLHYGQLTMAKVIDSEGHIQHTWLLPG